MSGLVVWFTGPPSSGKSTLAAKVTGALHGARVVTLDGDEVRAALRPVPGYSEAERDAFYETLARLAAVLARQGCVVLVPATAHLRRFRERARALAPAFVEVYVATPPEECRRRDTKGLYARAEANLPGASVAYEVPEHPDLVISPDDQGAADRIASVIFAFQSLMNEVGERR